MARRRSRERHRIRLALPYRLATSILAVARGCCCSRESLRAPSSSSRARWFGGCSQLTLLVRCCCCCLHSRPRVPPASVRGTPRPTRCAVVADAARTTSRRLLAPRAAILPLACESVRALLALLLLSLCLCQVSPLACLLACLPRTSRIREDAGERETWQMRVDRRRVVVVVVVVRELLAHPPRLQTTGVSRPRDEGPRAPAACDT